MICADAETIGITNLPREAEEWKQAVMSGTLADACSVLPSKPKLMRAYLVLDIDRTERTPIQEALLAGIGSRTGNLSKKIRKEEEKTRDRLEAQLAVSAVTSQAWRDGPAGRSARAQLIEISLALSRARAETRARLARLAYARRDPGRSGGGSARLQHACVPAQCFTLFV